MRLPPEIVLWGFFASIFGWLLTIHYMHTDLPLISAPISRELLLPLLGC